MVLWRTFPWAPDAVPGRPFSPQHIPPSSGHGRFDLASEETRVLYLAESPSHAVAEAIQAFRGGELTARHLRRAGRPLGLCRVESRVEPGRIADLCDPDLLAEHRVAPDRIASRRRRVTQAIAQRIWDLGFWGLRWWSSFGGDWHGVVIFVSRAGKSLRFGAPEALEIDHPAVGEAADALGIPRRTS